MAYAYSELERIKRWLREKPPQERWQALGLIKYLESLIDDMGKSAPDRRSTLLREYHYCADRLRPFDDTDIGALILELAGDSHADAQLRDCLYIEAKSRAARSAQRGSVLPC